MTSPSMILPLEVPQTILNFFSKRKVVLLFVCLATWPLVIPSLPRIANLMLGGKYNLCHPQGLTPPFRLIWNMLRRAPRIHVATQDEEQKYWRSALRHNRRLANSDARFGGRTREAEMQIPVMAYYKPRLLPLYRGQKAPSDLDTGMYHLSAKNYRKWHHMVFPGPWHPTIKEAEYLKDGYSNRDLQEMYRIARMSSDEQVFRGSSPWTPRYRAIWDKWLETKGPDTSIVFE